MEQADLIKERIGLCIMEIDSDVAEEIFFRFSNMLWPEVAILAMITGSDLIVQAMVLLISTKVC